MSEKRPVDFLFPGRQESIAEGKCQMVNVDGKCHGDGTATKFRDEASKREFKISGMCQACQDNFYGTE